MRALRGISAGKATGCLVLRQGQAGVIAVCAGRLCAAPAHRDVRGATELSASRWSICVTRGTGCGPAAHTAGEDGRRARTGRHPSCSAQPGGSGKRAFAHVESAGGARERTEAVRQDAGRVASRVARACRDTRRGPPRPGRSRRRCAPGAEGPDRIAPRPARGRGRQASSGGVNGAMRRRRSGAWHAPPNRVGIGSGPVCGTCGRWAARLGRGAPRRCAGHAPGMECVSFWTSRP